MTDFCPTCGQVLPKREMLRGYVFRPSEMRYLRDLAEGLSNQEIAEKYSYSPQTVATELHRLSEMIRPEEIYRWDREQFRTYVQEHVLKEEKSDLS